MNKHPGLPAKTHKLYKAILARGQRTITGVAILDEPDKLAAEAGITDSIGSHLHKLTTSGYIKLGRDATTGHRICRILKY
ncbi:hypothetical protein [Nocardia sp. NPDC051833]|uniref:hypothetical protein n=1 Tax=Nocardia sp. NPDC051833 TaxID=3155674 RepID=UPI003443F864